MESSLDGRADSLLLGGRRSDRGRLWRGLRAQVRPSASGGGDGAKVDMLGSDGGLAARGESTEENRGKESPCGGGGGPHHIIIRN